MRLRRPLRPRARRSATRTSRPSIRSAAAHFSRCHFHEKAARAPPRDERRRRPWIRAKPDGVPVVRLEHASKTFSHEGNEVRALVDVELAIGAGETVGLVGESGSGKTTLARVLLGLTAADADSTVELAGERLAPRIVKRTPEQVRALQTVFQNPDSALNRRSSVRRIIGRAITKLVGVRGRAARGAPPRDRLVGALRRAPAERAARSSSRAGSSSASPSARAFAGEPRVVVCDEPTSALDVSVQAAILNLLADLQASRGRHVPLHLPRSRSCPLPLRPDRRPLSRPPDGARRGGDGVQRSPPPVHGSAPLGGPDAGGRGAAADQARRRDSERRRPAHRLRLPHALSALPRRDLRGAGAARSPRSEPGHFLRCHIPVDELRRLQAEPPPPRSRQLKTTS